MSKFTDALGNIGIHNPSNFAGKGNVYISYSPSDNGRGGRCAHWGVHIPYGQTDPGAHWMDNGSKTFSVLGRDSKQPRLEEAKAWASAKYGIKEWARTPFGSWMDAEFVKKRMAQLKLALAAKDKA